MKYTAFALVLVGGLIACFAGYLYASGGPPGQAERPSTASLVLPLGFAAALVAAGAAMWTWAGKGYTVSEHPSAPRPTERPHEPSPSRAWTRPTSWSSDQPRQGNGGVQPPRHAGPG
jgi:hypothetical protein